MTIIRFLTTMEIIEMHDNLINQFGGKYGIRDHGLLESAIFQPQAFFAGKYLHTNIYEMAEAYMFHIIKNHPFIDGNKRTGTLAAIVFMENNDYQIKPTFKDLYQLAIDTANSKLSKQKISKFFKKNSLEN